MAIFSNLEAFLAGNVSLEIDTTENPTSKELQVATVTLLSEAAKASEGITSNELARVLGSLFREFGLSDEEGSSLLEISDLVLRENASRMNSFIDSVRTHFTIEQRIKLMSLIWRVLIADGKADSVEATFAASLRKKLDLSLEQALRAQQLAAKGTFLSELQETTSEDEVT